MNSQSSAVSSFSTNENKALLWSVLHGGGKFTGISESQVHIIKEIFEQTIHDMSEHCRRLNQPVNLNAINKEAVVIICKKIETVKQSQQQQQQQQQQQSFHNPQQIYQKKQQHIPQLETVYRAEDIQKERQSAFQNEFKKKEQEMSSILKLKKPEEINFMDDIYDKPIGNDMERLLAEALASRERELEQIKNIAFTTPPQPQLLQQPDPKGASMALDVTSPSSNQNFITYKQVRDNNHGTTRKDSEKRVSFENELHIIETTETTETTENNQNCNEICENGGDEPDINVIFNKFKKIKKIDSEEFENYLPNGNNNNNNNNNNNVNENNNSHTIIKMSQDIECIKTTLAELMEKINSLYRREK